LYLIEAISTNFMRSQHRHEYSLEILKSMAVRILEYLTLNNCGVQKHD
jgi:hypothetical protein